MEGGEEILVNDPGNINVGGSSLCNNPIGFNAFWFIYLMESIAYILITLFALRYVGIIAYNLAWSILFTFIYILIVFLCLGSTVKKDGTPVLIYILFVIFKFIFFYFLLYYYFFVNCIEINKYVEYQEKCRFLNVKSDFSLLFFSNIGAAFFDLCLLVYSCITSKISLLAVFIFGVLSSLIMFLSLFSYIEMVPAGIVAGLILFEVLSIMIPVSIQKKQIVLQGVNSILSQLLLDYYRFIPIMLLIYIFVLLMFYLACCVLKCACYCLAYMCGGGTPKYVDQDGNYYDECKNRIYFVI